MLRPPSARMEAVASSLREMKEALHPWDDVDNQIDEKLIEIDKLSVSSPPSPDTVKALEEARDRLLRLTFKELDRNIANVETMAQGLKWTAFLGLAIPTAVLAAYAAPLATAAIGNGLAAGGALMVAGGLLDGAIGSGANALGQGISSLIFWDGGWSGEDWKEMTWGHIQWGASAAGVLPAGKAVLSIPWRQHRWALGLPSALAVLSSGAVVRQGWRNRTAPVASAEAIDAPKDNPEDSVYRQSPEAYLGLAARFNRSGGIDAEEGATLFRLMRGSGNPEIEWAYAQMAGAKSPDFPAGSWITMYKTGATRKNLCLNFSGEARLFPCGEGLELAATAPNFSVAFQNGGLREDYAGKLAGLKINEGISIVAEHMGNVSLVSHLLPKIYEGLFLPEAVCVVTHILLNIFLTGGEISAEVQRYYTGLLQDAAHRYVTRFREEREGLRPLLASTPASPQTMGGVGLVEVRPYENPEALESLLKRIRVEGESLQSAWAYYRSWAKQRWSHAIYQGEEKQLADFPATLGRIYSNWPEIHYKLFQEPPAHCSENSPACPSRYEKGVEEAYFAMNMEYLKRSRDIYALWRDSSGLEGAFLGWIVSDFVFRPAASGTAGAVETFFWKNAADKSVWVLAGYLASRNGAALVEASETPLPLPLHLPELTGFISQEILEKDSDN